MSGTSRIRGIHAESQDSAVITDDWPYCRLLGVAVVSSIAPDGSIQRLNVGWGATRPRTGIVFTSAMSLPCLGLTLTTIAHRRDHSGRAFPADAGVQLRQQGRGSRDEHRPVSCCLWSAGLFDCSGRLLRRAGGVLGRCGAGNLGIPHEIRGPMCPFKGLSCWPVVFITVGAGIDFEHTFFLPPHHHAVAGALGLNRDQGRDSCLAWQLVFQDQRRVRWLFTLSPRASGRVFGFVLVLLVTQRANDG